MASILLTSFFQFFAADTADAACKKTFFGLKPWFYYLKLGDDCSIDNFQPLNTTGTGSVSDFSLIVLAVVDDLMRLAALIAVGFVIYGGISYITSQGSPEGTKKAQQTLINALIGLAVAIIAAGFVSYLGHRLGSTPG